MLYDKGFFFSLFFGVPIGGGLEFYRPVLLSHYRETRYGNAGTATRLWGN